MLACQRSDSSAEGFSSCPASFKGSSLRTLSVGIRWGRSRVLLLPGPLSVKRECAYVRHGSSSDAAEALLKLCCRHVLAANLLASIAQWRGVRWKVFVPSPRADQSHSAESAGALPRGRDHPWPSHLHFLARRPCSAVARTTCSDAGPARSSSARSSRGSKRRFRPRASRGKSPSSPRTTYFTRSPSRRSPLSVRVVRRYRASRRVPSARGTTMVCMRTRRHSRRRSSLSARTVAGLHTARRSIGKRTRSTKSIAQG